MYNRSLVDLARHYGFQPRACRPYRPKTKGKVERPFRYVRQDFFLARSFRDLDDLDVQFRRWLDEVANARLHATTKRIVAEAFADEKPTLLPLPQGPYTAVLKLERRVSHEGTVSVGGNLYSVPDTTRRRVLDVHVLADRVPIYEDGTLVAAHLPIDGRGQIRLDPAHRKPRTGRTGPSAGPPEEIVVRTGDLVAQRSLDVYDAIGRGLAGRGGAS